MLKSIVATFACDELADAARKALVHLRSQLSYLKEEINMREDVDGKERLRRKFDTLSRDIVRLQESIAKVDNS